MKVIRNIGWYKPGSDKQRGDYILSETEFEPIRALFTAKDDDPYFQEDYLITAHHMELMREMVTLKFQPDRYEYYLECWQAGG